MGSPGTRQATSRTAAAVGWVVPGLATTMAVAWIVALDFVVAAAWLPPIGWALALTPVTLLALVSLVPPGRTNASVKWLSWSAVLAGVLVVLVPWNQRKRFVHDVHSVRVGMSVDEVEAILGGYIHGAGPKWQGPPGPDPLVRGLDDPQDPTATEQAEAAFAAYPEPEYPAGPARRHATGVMTYRWSTDWKYDSDWGLVHFLVGRVVKVEFLPD